MLRMDPPPLLCPPTRPGVLQVTWTSQAPHNAETKTTLAPNPVHPTTTRRRSQCWCWISRSTLAVNTAPTQSWCAPRPPYAPPPPPAAPGPDTPASSPCPCVEKQDRSQVGARRPPVLKLASHTQQQCPQEQAHASPHWAWGDGGHHQTLTAHPGTHPRVSMLLNKCAATGGGVT
jgi:hypothetical protein